MRLGQRSSENGIIPEEYENEYAIDRVETLGVGILGHTVGCARCHDHKYDPISISDFYAFAGFFSKTLENGFYSPGGSIENPGFVGAEHGASLILPDAETETKLAELEAEIEARQLDYNNTLAMTEARLSAEGLPNKAQAYSEITAALEASLAAHYSFESVYEGDLDFAKIEIYGRQEQGQPLAVSKNMPAGIREDLVRLSASEIYGQVPAVIQSPILGEGIVGNAFVFDEQNKGYFRG